MKKDNKLLIIIGVILVIILSGFITVILSTPIKFEGSMSCSSGDVDINARFEEIKKTEPCLYNTSENCTRDDIPINVTLYGIDDLNCEAKGSFEYPLIYTFFFGDIMN